MRGTNWPAGVDACASNCSIHVLVCVWSQMSYYKWLKLSLEFIFAVRHTSGHSKPRYMKLWCHNDIIYMCYYHWHFCQQIQLFQAWCNNGQRQSGNSAHVQQLQQQQCAKFLHKVRATRYSIVTDCNCKVLIECIIESALSYMHVRF